MLGLKLIHVSKMGPRNMEMTFMWPYHKMQTLDIGKDGPDHAFKPVSTICLVAITGE